MTLHLSCSAWGRAWLLGRLVLLVGLVVGFASADLAVAGQPLLSEKHKTASLECNACHKENPPKVAAPMATCIACHGGTYEKLMEKTQAVKPHNPHQSHEGEIECGECHRVHKPSVDYCERCHQFGFKVP
jgi:fumarate reductase flavoprotein subunit